MYVITLEKAILEIFADLPTALNAAKDTAASSDKPVDVMMKTHTVTPVRTHVVEEFFRAKS